MLHPTALVCLHYFLPSLNSTRWFAGLCRAPCTLQCPPHCLHTAPAAGQRAATVLKRMQFRAPPQCADPRCPHTFAPTHPGGPRRASGERPYIYLISLAMSGWPSQTGSSETPLASRRQLQRRRTLGSNTCVHERRIACPLRRPYAWLGLSLVSKRPHVAFADRRGAPQAAPDVRSPVPVPRSRQIGRAHV